MYIFYHKNSLNHPYINRQFAEAELMEKGIKQTNTLYNIFCICICLLIWALSYFQGHVYISPNGYAVLNDNLLNPIGIDEKGRAEQSVMHEMILNGGHFNLIYRTSLPGNWLLG